MLILEAFLKFGSISIMCTLAVLILRDGRNIPALRFALPLTAAMVCMLLTTGSTELKLVWPWLVPLRLFDSFSTLFIWWFGLSLFDDDFELGLFEWSAAAIYAAIALPVKWYFLGLGELWFPQMYFVSASIGVLMMLHLAYKAIKGRKEDLLEKRRRVRVWFAGSIGLVLTASIVIELAANVSGLDSKNTIWITYTFTLPIAIWAVLWITQLNPNAIKFESATLRNELEPKAENKADIDPRDIVVHKKLVALMEEERVYSTNGLTIGSLASLLAIPEHQLRVLINRSMGYQNFSSFLNHYRIKDVQDAFALDEHRRTPILTLAMNAGFSSLAPFNRAFKKEVGLTPSDYRSNLLDRSAVKAVQN